jgi:hypothetical protein
VGDTTLHVLVLLDSTSKTADVKFVGTGAAGGTPLTEALRTATYPVVWPDAAASKLVRRGELRCTAAAKTCELVLDLPEDVRTLDPQP